MEVDYVYAPSCLGDLLPILRFGGVPVGIDKADSRGVARLRSSRLPERRLPPDRHLDDVVENREQLWLDLLSRGRGGGLLRFVEQGGEALVRRSRHRLRLQLSRYRVDGRGVSARLHVSFEAFAVMGVPVIRLSVDHIGPVAVPLADVFYRVASARKAHIFRQLAPGQLPAMSLVYGYRFEDFQGKGIRD